MVEPDQTAAIAVEHQECGAVGLQRMGLRQASQHHLTGRGIDHAAAGAFDAIERPLGIVATDQEIDASKQAQFRWTFASNAQCLVVARSVTSTRRTD